ncbi:chemotaxis protein CheB [Amycolatopsis sp. cmx-8-4]|uniref:chemotaxis protein CheB n=1 Tax=Amycolatopsis sp. cmx-8-4 TaxID=2790947 RepID=UPI00397BCD74
MTSAGGLAALTHVLAPLPRGLSAALLVACHQPADRPSRLVFLLDQHTDLTVRAAEDGAQLTPGVVLVAPPGRHLMITSPTHVGLLDTGPHRPRPSADLLLTTLAIACGTRAVAVVLTGAGTDGQLGVRAVTHRGGTVIAQDEASSAYFSMPAAAIATGQVQKVLPPAGIATAIHDHVIARTATVTRLELANTPRPRLPADVEEFNPFDLSPERQPPGKAPAASPVDPSPSSTGLA